VLPIGEGLAVGVDLDVLAMAGEGDVGGVAVHQRVGEE